MANPSKAKGTGGETELLRLLNIEGLVRTPPATVWDLERQGALPPVEVLATRPDRGRWLITTSVDDFRRMFHHYGGDHIVALRVEVKRYKKFSLHSIYEAKFGGKK